jgi:YfiH family protein
VSEGTRLLNCGRGSGDDRDRVEENRARVAKSAQRPECWLVRASAFRALIVTAPWKPGEAPEADAVVTNVRGLAVSVLTADCAPILFADLEAGVVAAAHAGWKGAKAGIAESTIEAMESAPPERISAAIGPAISQAAYEVSPSSRPFVADAGARNHFAGRAAGRISTYPPCARASIE